MGNPILDLLGDVGYAMDTPGAYFRGALSGNLGQRASGEDLLNSWGLDGGPVGGVAAEVVTDPLALAGLAGGAYKGVQGVTRGARRLAGMGEADPLARRLAELAAGVEDPLDAVRFASRQGESSNPVARALAGFVGDENGALLPGFAPFSAGDVESVLGRRFDQIPHGEALSAYEPWVAGLADKERAAAKMYTSGPQGRISHALRNPGSGGGPFDEPLGAVPPGSAPILTPEDVMREVVPHLDSALGRAQSPRDLMTYRLARRVGDLTPETAEGMVGRTVSDPSYVSTTVDPRGRFYGRSAEPYNMLLDIAVPDRSQAGYVGGLSNWRNEKEMILPRGADFRVAAARDVPVQNIDHWWHRLDPEGKPVPVLNSSNGALFRDVPDDELADLLRGRPGEFVVPDEFMAPDWRRFRDANLVRSGVQKNILLEMLGKPQGG